MKISRHSGLFNWFLRAVGRPRTGRLARIFRDYLLNVYQAIVNFRFTEYKSRPGPAKFCGRLLLQLNLLLCYCIIEDLKYNANHYH